MRILEKEGEAFGGTTDRSVRVTQALCEGVRVDVTALRAGSPGEDSPGPGRGWEFRITNPPVLQVNKLSTERLSHLPWDM